jgi:hypothetical protein
VSGRFWLEGEAGLPWPSPDGLELQPGTISLGIRTIQAFVGLTWSTDCPPGTMRDPSLPGVMARNGTEDLGSAEALTASEAAFAADRPMAQRSKPI